MTAPPANGDVIAQAKFPLSAASRKGKPSIGSGISPGHLKDQTRKVVVLHKHIAGNSGAPRTRKADQQGYVVDLGRRRIPTLPHIARSPNE